MFAIGKCLWIIDCLVHDFCVIRQMPLSIFNAVKANNLDEVQRYFAGNGLPDIITSYEYDSLLHVAVRNGASIDVIKTLARYVNIDQRNAWGETALHLACIQERFDVIEVVRLLLRWGSDINAQNINGETPLHWSSAHGKLDVVKFLVTHGANVDNSTTRELLTPLHTAVQNRHMAVVSCLLSSNASPDSRDVYHRTPRMLAKQNGFDEIVALIDSYIPPESESESAAKQEGDTIA